VAIVEQPGLLARLAEMAGAAMTKYLKRASTAKAGCAALAAVCLRQSDNTKQVVLE
jgi:hypothetical protein